ncbi:MAG: hypothetical protein ACRDAU_16430 [Clostridium sp.]
MIRNIDEETKKYIKIIILAIITCLGYYLIFRNANELLNSIADNILSIPITIIFTWLFIDNMFEKKEREKKKEKLNILSGVFFGEFGTALLTEFIRCDDNCEDLKEKAKITEEWEDKNFSELEEFFEEHDYNIIGRNIDVKILKEIIDNGRDFMIDILFNSAIGLGEEFTQVVIDTLHLREEIEDLEDINNINDNEILHLEEDISRVYRCLSIGWVKYIKNLSGVYPHLFMKALKKSPYNGCLLKQKKYRLSSYDE